MKLTAMDKDFSICSLSGPPKLLELGDFLFYAKTDEEISLVCDRAFVPENVKAVQHGWRAFKIKGILDFSMVGVIAGISAVLADNGISVFVASTFNTDYILVEADKFRLAALVLENSKYEIE